MLIARPWVSDDDCRYTLKHPCAPFLRVTPPLLVRSIQGVFRQYAVRKGSVRSTQNPVIAYADINYHF